MHGQPHIRWRKQSLHNVGDYSSYVSITNNILRVWIFRTFHIIRYPFEILTGYYIVNHAATLTCFGNRKLLGQRRAGIIARSACRLYRMLVCVTVSFGRFFFYLHIYALGQQFIKSHKKKAYCLWRRDGGDPSTLTLQTTNKCKTDERN